MVSGIDCLPIPDDRGRTPVSRAIASDEFPAASRESGQASGIDPMPDGIRFKRLPCALPEDVRRSTRHRPLKLSRAIWEPRGRTTWPDEAELTPRIPLSTRGG